jgi:hypothetical protein
MSSCVLFLKYIWLFIYLHNEPSVNEPRSLNDAEVGATKLHQTVVIENLKMK